MDWQNLSILSLFYTIFSCRVLKNLRKCKWDFLYMEMEIYIKKFLHIFETLSLSFHVTLLFIRESATPCISIVFDLYFTYIQ